MSEQIPFDLSNVQDQIDQLVLAGYLRLVGTAENGQPQYKVTEAGFALARDLSGGGMEFPAADA